MLDLFPSSIFLLICIRVFCIFLNPFSSFLMLETEASLSSESLVFLDLLFADDLLLSDYKFGHDSAGCPFLPQLKHLCRRRISCCMASNHHQTSSWHCCHHPCPSIPFEQTLFPLMQLQEGSSLETVKVCFHFLDCFGVVV